MIGNARSIVAVVVTFKVAYRDRRKSPFAVWASEDATLAVWEQPKDDQGDCAPHPMLRKSPRNERHDQPSTGNFSMPSPTTFEGTMDRGTTITTAAPKLVLEAVRSSFDLPIFPLAPGRHLVGSSSECDVVIPVAGVAEQHCLIIVGASRTIIKALSPLTWINDGPVTEAVLPMTARLILGPVELQTRRPEVSEWLGATEERRVAPPPAKQYEPPRIDELLEQARTHLQRAIDDPPIEALPTAIDRSEEMPLAAAVEAHALRQTTAAQTEPESETNSKLREELAQRELELNERSRSLDYLGSELGQLEQRLLGVEQNLVQRETMLREKQASIEQRASLVESREAALLAESQTTAQAQQACLVQQQETETLSAQLEHRWNEIEDRAAQLDAQQREIAELSELLDVRQRELADSACQLGQSLTKMPTQDAEELAHRESLVSRREATLTESLSALAATRQQLIADSAQLEARYAELTTREQALHLAQTQHQQQALLPDPRREDLDAALEELHQGQMSADARDAALSQRELSVTQRERSLESRKAELDARDRELRGLRSEHDIQAEAVNQQFSQLQLDRAALRSAQAKWQSLEQSLLQREQALASQNSTRQSREREIEATTHQAPSEVDARLEQLVQREAELKTRNADLTRREQQVVASEHALLSHQGELSRSEYEINQWLETIQHDRTEIDQLRAEFEQQRAMFSASPSVSAVDSAERNNEEDQRRELESLRDSLVQERDRLQAEFDQLASARAEFDAERANWTTTRLESPEYSPTEKFGDQLQSLVAERDALKKKANELAEQEAFFRSEQLRYREQAQELQQERSECEALRAEATQERDTYLLERQAAITERQALKDRDRAIQKTEVDAEALRTELAELKRELELEQDRTLRQRQSLTEDWNLLREEQSALETRSASLKAEREDLLQQSATLDSQRDELRSLVDQFTSIQGGSMETVESVKDEPLSDPVATLVDDEVLEVTDPTDTASSAESFEVVTTEVEYADEEEEVVPDKLAGFASFASIDDSDDLAIPPEVARLLGIPANAKPTSPDVAAHSEKVETKESLRLLELLRRQSFTIMEEATADSAVEFEIVPEVPTVYEVADQGAVSEPVASDPIETPASDTSPSGTPEDLAIRNRLSEMFGINLGSRSATQPSQAMEDEFPAHEATPSPAGKDTTATSKDWRSKVWQESSSDLGHVAAHPVASQPTEPEPAPASSSSDPVAAYMEQLLARTRKAQPDPAPPVPTVVKSETFDGSEEESPTGNGLMQSTLDMEVPPPPVEEHEPEMPQRKIPQNKVALRANLDSFRTIANSKARSDLAVSEYKRLRLTIQVKRVLLYACGGVTVVMILMQVISRRLMIAEMAGAALASGFLGWDYWKTCRRLRELQLTAGVEDSQIDGEVPDSLHGTPDL